MGQFLIVFVLIASTGQVDSRSNNDLVTVSGCVRGNLLKLPIEASAIESTLRASEYVLEGSKETLRAIRKDHDGHYLEVTGTVKLPKDSKVYQKQVGPKTRITVGERETDGYQEPMPIRLVVSSYRDLADQCHERDR